MPESDIDYIECAGVTVPANWTVQQLRSALVKRDIRFQNEQEIMRVFGQAVELKTNLERQVADLSNQKQKLESQVKQLEGKMRCPHCQKPLFEEPVT